MRAAAFGEGGELSAQFDPGGGGAAGGVDHGEGGEAGATVGEQRPGARWVVATGRPLASQVQGGWPSCTQTVRRVPSITAPSGGKRIAGLPARLEPGLSLWERPA